MTIPIFKVDKGGLFTTIQDAGRFGYQKQGIIASGVMDEYAFFVGNILIGNTPNTSCLEITLIGPTLVALKKLTLSICGANLSPMVDGKKVGMWKALVLQKGQTLSFGKPIQGARAYICVQGGFHADTVLGSSSTYTRGEMGGLNGNCLIRGDILHSYQDAFSYPITHGLSHSLVPTYCPDQPIRVILGPEIHRFTREGVKTFLSETYSITNAADRMGYRLDGPMIEHENGADILSAGINKGTIQVPKDGKPIILLSDRQTTGGYTRIANVISVDLALLAQRIPGQKITFVETTIEKAQQEKRKQAIFLKQLKNEVSEVMYS